LLGATANAAFRVSIFSHPQIGLMDEALGPGMPSGVGEDIYVFYKVLKAGYTVIYEPAAFVWHKHRRDMSALRRQLYGYSKGIISYHLNTLVRDRDQRALLTVAVDIPLWHLKRVKERLLGRSSHPIKLILLEIAGNLAAPWSLWKSYQRVRSEGRSGPYVPVSQRLTDTYQLQLVSVEASRCLKSGSLQRANNQPQPTISLHKGVDMAKGSPEQLTYSHATPQISTDLSFRE
jgi:hypothetical protein